MMEKNTYCQIVLFASLLFLLTLCFECEPQDKIPFKEGDFFKYQIDHPKELYRVYTIERIEDGKWRVSEDADGEPGRRHLVEFITDINGKITKVAGNLFMPEEFIGKQIGLWLPYNKRKKGETIFFDNKTVNFIILERKWKWKKWDVWVAEYTKEFEMFGEKRKERGRLYFDKKTGFLVGKEFSLHRSTLKDTNVDMIH